MDLTRQVKIHKYNENQLSVYADTVVREVPVTLFVNDDELVTLVCTPHGLKELAIGFLCSEGILSKPDDLKNVTINHNDGLIWVETSSQETPIKNNFMKRYITTCCGRGRVSFYFINDATGIKPLAAGSSLRITTAEITSLSAALEEKSGLFRLTGGAHGAALCRPDGIISFYEDIGRHNAVDKLFGHSFLEAIPLEDKAIVLSGRISSEILIKVGRMGIPIVISRAAPSDLALQMADELGITVIGFVRGNKLNIYTHPERVTLYPQDR